MPPPDPPETIAADLITALVAGLTVVSRADDLYDALGTFTDAKTWVGTGANAGYALTVRPGWSPLSPVKDYVILSEVQTP